jgi:chromate transport protein ChrA
MNGKPSYSLTDLTEYFLKLGTVGFIGYLVAGLPGACVAAAAAFLPCYILTVLPAPYFKK